MAALSVSKQFLLGWQMALTLRRVTQFCPSHLLFSPLSWPCSPHCQLPSQVPLLRRSAGRQEERVGGEASEKVSKFGKCVF